MGFGRCQLGAVRISTKLQVDSVCFPDLLHSEIGNYMGNGLVGELVGLGFWGGYF